MSIEDARARYDAIVVTMTANTPSTSGKIFGMPCLKTEFGKAYAGYVDGAMVFKLSSPTHGEALALPGSRLFDPMGGRPMKEWVVVPVTHAEQWLTLAEAARNYVAG